MSGVEPVSDYFNKIALFKINRFFFVAKAHVHEINQLKNIQIYSVFRRVFQNSNSIACKLAQRKSDILALHRKRNI